MGRKNRDPRAKKNVRYRDKDIPTFIVPASKEALGIDEDFPYGLGAENRLKRNRRAR